MNFRRTGNFSFMPNFAVEKQQRCLPSVMDSHSPDALIEEFPDDDDSYMSEMSMPHVTNPVLKNPNSGGSFTYTDKHSCSSVGGITKWAHYSVERTAKPVSAPNPVTPRKTSQNQNKTIDITPSASSKKCNLPTRFSNERLLCFLTVPIPMLKQWKRYRDEVQMLVEVIGVLESCTVDSKKPSVKWLKLQDQGHFLDCFFCEMDRCLPNLALKQYYRCVGTITREGTLLCVSIRPATKQEEKWKNTLMSLSAKAMYKQMAKLSEV